MVDSHGASFRPQPGTTRPQSARRTTAVLQRTGSRPSARPARRRGVGGRAGQSQRPDPLSRLPDRGAVSPARPGPGRWRLSAASTSSSRRAFECNRILRDENWRRYRKRRARVEHALARPKDWRVLRDHRRRGRSLSQTLAGVAFLHALRIVVREIVPKQTLQVSVAHLAGLCSSSYREAHRVPR